MRSAWVVVGAVVLLLGAGVLLLASRYSPRLGRLPTAAAARWREMHTPSAGLARALPPRVQPVVSALRAAGLERYRFTPRMEATIELASFIVEASWPIQLIRSGSDFVGYADELASQPSCKVLATMGEIVLAHCGP